MSAHRRRTEAATGRWNDRAPETHTKWPKLYVVNASFFPSCAGLNPSLTVPEPGELCPLNHPMVLVCPGAWRLVGSLLIGLLGTNMVYRG